MLLEIKAGDYAVLRDGTVPEESIKRCPDNPVYWWCIGPDYYTKTGRYLASVDEPHHLDIVATFAARDTPTPEKG